MPPTKARPRTSGKKPPGRKPPPPRKHTKMLDVIEWRNTDTGEEIGYTVADRILDAIRHNMTVKEAAAAAGVPFTVLQSWTRLGSDTAREQAKMAAGERPYVRPTKAAEAYWWFFQELAVAEAQAEHRLVNALDALATGEGLMNETRVKKVHTNADGEEEVLEETVKVSSPLPNAEAAKFLLSHRHRERWGQTETLEIVGAAGGPVEHNHTVTAPQLESLIDLIRDRHLNPIDTSAAETPELGEGS